MGCGVRVGWGVSFSRHEKKLKIVGCTSSMPEHSILKMSGSLYLL